jgi:hypothetical protein
MELIRSAPLLNTGALTSPTLETIENLPWTDLDQLKSVPGLSFQKPSKLLVKMNTVQPHDHRWWNTMSIVILVVLLILVIDGCMIRYRRKLYKQCPVRKVSTRPVEHISLK